MIGARGRYVVQEFLSQITVRVDHANAMSIRNVLDNQIAQKRGLSRTSFTDDVNMLALILGRNAKRPEITPALALADDNEWFIISWFQNQPPLLSAESLGVVRLSQ
jgi:phage-related tail fiber protein